jgi:hypothetical protein
VEWGRDGQRELGSEAGQPPVFSAEWLGALVPAGQSDGQVIAQAPHLVAPAADDLLQLEIGQVRMLGFQQGPHEVVVHFQIHGPSDASHRWLVGNRFTERTVADSYAH